MMKIFFAVVVIVLLFVIGATLYVYKKSAMFLPALLGICRISKNKGKQLLQMKTDISVQERGGQSWIFHAASGIRRF